ncbi:hypothetical protein BDR07DRAFT_1410806 [Suillus spraguei]|nr:hypothetical protein BDR07DRAFT_1410806 [Suillus spraguei]
MDPVSCTEKHVTCHTQRNLGTGRWIFHVDEFKTWNTSDCAFLWLNGQPGHGKTILASSIIDEIKGSSEAEPQTLSYFYCNFRDERTTNAAAVLRSLIVQLLQQSKDDWITKIGEQPESNTKGDFDSLRDLWQQKRNAKTYPTDLRFLRKILIEVSTLVHRPVLVIDALDECKDYSDLVGHLVNLAEDAQLRLFREQMKADICVHITEQLKNQKRLSRLPDALKKTILEKLLEKAQGMFRWVQCQLDVIVTCKRPDSIRKALDDLPAGLYETYDRIIHSIDERGKDDGPIAQRCLLFLADTMDIIAACGSLVTYNEKTGIVALSHYSVKEYLINRPNNIFKSISDMHARICELLITYVLCDFVDEICAKGTHPALQSYAYIWANISKDNPLLSYAIKGWRHLRHVSDEDPDVMTALSRLNSEFLRNTKKHLVLKAKDDQTYVIHKEGRNFHTLRWLTPNTTFPSLLFIPLEHGKPWMVEFLVKQHPHLLDTDISPGWGSPLIFAIAERPDFLSIFLKPGVHLNRLSSFKLFSYLGPREGSYAPISCAAAAGNEVATDVDIPNDILHVAAPSHECIRKFRRCVNGSTPIHMFLLHSASRSYDKSQLLPVLNALVEPFCNLSLQDRTARTALHLALDYRLEDIVPYLLEQNAGLSATATLHPDMWSWATNEMWFPKVQAAALAADQSCTRIMGRFPNFEFSVAVTADRENRNPICGVVVSAILDGKLSCSNLIHANLSYCNQSLQKKVQDSRKYDSPGPWFCFEWRSELRASSWFYQVLQQLDEDKDSTGTSLFLQIFKEEWNAEVFEVGVECILDVYRGPLP